MSFCINSATLQVDHTLEQIIVNNTKNSFDARYYDVYKDKKTLSLNLCLADSQKNCCENKIGGSRDVHLLL